MISNGKHKPDRQQREQLRQFHADTFNEGFKMGYNIGYQQALSDTKYHAIIPDKTT